MSKPFAIAFLIRGSFTFRTLFSLENAPRRTFASPTTPSPWSQQQQQQQQQPGFDKYCRQVLWPLMHNVIVPAARDLHASVKIGRLIGCLEGARAAGGGDVMGCSASKPRKTIDYDMPPYESRASALMLSCHGFVTSPACPRRRSRDEAVGGVRPREPAVCFQAEHVLPTQATHLGPRVGDGEGGGQGEGARVHGWVHMGGCALFGSAGRGRAEG